MTRPIWGAPPEPEALAERPLHRVVADLPETLGPLRALGVDPREVGARALRDAAGERWEETLARLEAALAWRRPA